MCFSPGFVCAFLTFHVLCDLAAGFRSPLTAIVASVTDLGRLHTLYSFRHLRGLLVFYQFVFALDIAVGLLDRRKTIRQLHIRVRLGLRRHGRMRAIQTLFGTRPLQ